MRDIDVHTLQLQLTLVLSFWYQHSSKPMSKFYKITNFSHSTTKRIHQKEKQFLLSKFLQNTFSIAFEKYDILNGIIKTTIFCSKTIFNDKIYNWTALIFKNFMYGIKEDIGFKKGFRRITRKKRGNRAKRGKKNQNVRHVWVNAWKRSQHIAIELVLPFCLQKNYKVVLCLIFH